MAVATSVGRLKAFRGIVRCKGCGMPLRVGLVTDEGEVNCAACAQSLSRLKMKRNRKLIGIIEGLLGEREVK
jgi:hypothetical protein